MAKTDLFFWLNLLLTTFVGILGFAFRDQGLWTALFILMGAIWFYTHQRSPGKTSSLILLCLVICACIGLLLGISGIAAYICVVTGLATWDLDQFNERLAEAQRYNLSINSTQLNKWINAHLKRLGIVEALALIIGGIGLAIHIHLGFGLVIIFSIFGSLGLSRLIGYLKRMSK